MAITIEMLKTACYFSELDASSLEDVSRFIFEKKLLAGEVVVWEGEKNEAVYFAISGLLKLFTTSREGREFTARIAFGGDSFNDDAIFNNGTSILNAMTMSPVVIYGLSRRDLGEILRTYPEVNSLIAKVLAGRERYYVQLAEDLVFNSVTGRLARFLLEKEKIARAGNKDVRVTQQEMASIIGTVREIVSRSLKELETMGAISMRHNQIVITNRNRLSELSIV